MFLEVEPNSQEAQQRNQETTLHLQQRGAWETLYEDRAEAIPCAKMRACSPSASFLILDIVFRGPAAFLVPPTGPLLIFSSLPSVPTVHTMTASP